MFNTVPNQSETTNATDTTRRFMNSPSVTNPQTRPFLLRSRPGPRLQIMTKWPSSRISDSTTFSSHSRMPANSVDNYRSLKSHLDQGQIPQSFRSPISCALLIPASPVPPPEYLVSASPGSIFGLLDLETGPWDDNRLENQLAKAEQAVCELRTELIFYYQRKLTKGDIPQSTKTSYEMRNEEHARAIRNYMTVGMHGHSAYKKEDRIEVRSDCTMSALVSSETNFEVYSSVCAPQPGDRAPLEYSRVATPEGDISPMKPAKTRAPLVPPRPATTKSRSSRRTRSPPPPTSSSSPDAPPPVPPLIHRKPPLIPPRPLTTHKRNITTPNLPLRLDSEFSTTKKQLQEPVPTGTIVAPYTSTLGTRHSQANRSAIRNQKISVSSPPEIFLSGSESTLNTVPARLTPFSALREAFDKGGLIMPKNN